jgi:hypothetical protein
LGHCIPEADEDRIATKATITAEEFAVEVLKAEGWSPEQCPRLVRDLASLFEERISASVLTEGEEEPGHQPRRRDVLRLRSGILAARVNG